ncbi:MAG: ABC transporter permease [Saccharofermentanales bacterium]
MQVFKAYFGIIRKNLGQMSIYLGVFLGLSIMFANLGVGSVISEFAESKPPVAVFIEDDSVLAQGFKDYLTGETTIIPVKDDEDALRDALFYREVVYILRVPEGFGDQFVAGGQPLIGRQMVEDSIYAAYLDRMVDNYFTFAEGYLKFMPDITEAQLVEYVADDLAKESQVRLTGTQGKAKSRLANSVYYFNYFAYSLFAIILLGVCSFMLTFNDPDLKRRNTASPISATSMNLQLIAGNTVFALAVWAIMFFVSFLLFGKELVDPIALYYGINTLTYTLVCVGISFAVGSIIRSRGAQAAVVNILALGLSFLTGVFVPQEMLSDTVLRIGSFTPTYWFVRANRIINAKGSGVALLSGIISRELIMQLVFIVVLFAAAIIIRRRRQLASN